MKTFAQFSVLTVMFAIWGLAIAAGLCVRKTDHE